MKKIIIYFSRADENYIVGYIDKGNTKVIAEYIKEFTDADIFEIKPKNKYPKDYNRCIEVAKRELQSNDRPEVAEYLGSLDEYDLIYLGYPNWWGDVPMCVYTFLDKYDLTGKTIKTFCTHEGSGLGSTVSKLKKHYPNAIYGKGLEVQGCKVNEVKYKVEDWINE